MTDPIEIKGKKYEEAQVFKVDTYPFETIMSVGGCVGAKPDELLLFRRLPEPKPMPELKPGMAVAEWVMKFPIARVDGNDVHVWVESGNKLLQALLFKNTITEVFDSNDQSIWKREEA